MTNRSSPLHWITILALLASGAAVVLQWRTISRLRQENDALCAQSQLPDQAAAPLVPVAADQTVDAEQAQNDKRELLRLRNEVRQRRETASAGAADARTAASQLAQPDAVKNQPAAEDARQLVIAAMSGDARALERLANLLAAIQTMHPDEQARARMAIASAFEFAGTEAGKGNALALQTLWQASRIPRLEGFAAQGFGQAAALGNAEALKPLLDPEAYLILRSSAVSALKPAADAGNERAIQALAATASDLQQQPLWLLAAEGLQNAAVAGNASAVEGLARIAAGTNQLSSKEAVLALEAAARNNQPQAEAALRKLGWR